MPLQLEQLPSGKTIGREFAEDGSLKRETHSYGSMEIMIEMHFQSGTRVDEFYLVKRRTASRRVYEKARASFPDMPPADQSLEDIGGALLREVRRQQKKNKAAAEQRLAASAESRFPRPASTNWLRVISGDNAHLVEFASRDWKIFCKERNSLPTGNEWMRLFGFDGPPGFHQNVMEGPTAGYEVPGDRKALLAASKKLLQEVRAYVPPAPDPTWCQFSVRKKPKPRKPKPPAWVNLLPPLIAFLECLDVSTVTIFNHHR